MIGKNVSGLEKIVPIIAAVKFPRKIQEKNTAKMMCKPKKGEHAEKIPIENPNAILCGVADIRKIRLHI